MAGDIRIENLYIENAFFIPDGAPENTFAGLFEFLREQRDAGALTIMGEDGYPVSDEAAEPDETPTPEEQEELDQSRAEAFVMEQAKVDVVARANHLRNVAHHVTRARKLEGFQTNHENAPKKRSAVDKKQAKEMKLAQISLERACALCEFRNNCSMVDDAPKWTDVHAYIDDNTGKRRPGSSDVKEVESRKALSKAQDAGVAEQKQVHCDPSKRK